MEAPLPWDYDVDLGVRGEQFDTKRKELFHLLFTSGVECTNRLFPSGALICWRQGMKMRVDLFTFYNYFGTMKRRGWETWVIFIQ